jgi:hypothetical protein
MCMQMLIYCVLILNTFIESVCEKLAKDRASVLSSYIVYAQIVHSSIQAVLGDISENVVNTRIAMGRSLFNIKTKLRRVYKIHCSLPPTQCSI